MIQKGKTLSKPLPACHGSGTAWAWHGHDMDTACYLWIVLNPYSFHKANSSSPVVYHTSIITILAELWLHLAWKGSMKYNIRFHSDREGQCEVTIQQCPCGLWNLCVRSDIGCSTFVRGSFLPQYEALKWLLEPSIALGLMLLVVTWQRGQTDMSV